MYYLLYAASHPFDGSDEHFVLFQTDAEEHTAKQFITLYFPSHQLFGKLLMYEMFDDAFMDEVTFTKEEINSILQKQILQKQKEEERNHNRFVYLQEYEYKKNRLQTQFKRTELERNQTLYLYYKPEFVTEELVQQLKENGYERNRMKNGNIRFRKMNYEEIKEQFDVQLKNLKHEIQVASTELWEASRRFDRENPIEIPKKTVTYQRN